MNEQTLMNINFTRKELTAVLNVALGMAEIDGHLDNIEIESIYHAMAQLGIEQYDLFSLSKTAVRDMDPDDAMRIISNMTLLKKQYTQALLVVVMCADGEIDKREMTLLRVITMACNLPPISMNGIRQTVNQFRKL